MAQFHLTPQEMTLMDVAAEQPSLPDHVCWRQWKTQKNRFAELRRRGVNLKWARNTAASNRGPWHLSATKALTVALPNVFFSSLGLSSLEQATA